MLRSPCASHKISTVWHISRNAHAYLTQCRVAITDRRLRNFLIVFIPGEFDSVTKATNIPDVAKPKCTLGPTFPGTFPNYCRKDYDTAQKPM